MVATGNDLLPPVPAAARLAAALTHDLRIAAGLWAMLLGARLGLHAGLHAAIGSSATGSDVIHALLQGARFDLQMAMVAILPCLTLSMLTSSWTGPGGFAHRLRQRVRTITWVAVVWSTLVLGVVDWLYFKEFGAQFDAHLFELLHEDLRALAATVWVTYPVVWIGLGCLVLGGVVGMSARWVVGRGGEAAWAAWLGGVRRSGQWAGLVLLVVLVVIALRGSIAHRPLQSGTATVTNDRTLNRLTPSLWHALRTATRDYLARREDERSGSQTFATVDLSAACRTVLGTVPEDRSLDRASLRIAAGPLATPPRHIVLVVMESQSGWPLMEAHRQLGVMPELASLAERGTSVQRFVSAGGGTIYSLGPLFTGIPDCGIAQTLTPTTRRPFPTSLAPTFRRLGYRTRFFYGGFRASKRYGDFASDQGFEEVYGQAEVTVTRRRNSWGVDDADLYRFVAQSLDDVRPSFSVILTTSNHPPFEVDLSTTPFDAQALAAKSGIRDAEAIRVLGHLWYADHCAGAFVRAIEPRLPGLLVTLIGDHYGRRFLSGSPSPAERTAVPCVLYGPDVLAGQTCSPRMVGSHLDLLPTLIELAAPAGFAYHAWGHDLFGPEADWSIGNQAVVTPWEWIDVSAGTSAKMNSISDEALAISRGWCRDYTALAWWRLIKGSVLPSK
jgi:phosphoglycerol transferase MdoB-like AlkP superfamily enzyme